MSSNKAKAMNYTVITWAAWQVQSSGLVTPQNMDTLLRGEAVRTPKP